MVGWWFQIKYRVTPTWVEVWLDWVRLGCRLGLVVTINVLERIKLTKDSDNTVQGVISKKTKFRSNQSQEQFLFDTGTSVSIIGEKVAQDNHIQVTRLNIPRNIYEASVHQLNIIGESEFYVKLPVLGKVKRQTCLVFRGVKVDREIFISCSMLKNGT